MAAAVSLPGLQFQFLFGMPPPLSLSLFRSLFLSLSPSLPPGWKGDARHRRSLHLD